MATIKEFIDRGNDESKKGIALKNNHIKRGIIAHMMVHGPCTLAELTRHLDVSIPTITKLVGELVEENIVSDNGKIETSGGRRPNVFGLAQSAIYFGGVEIAREAMYFVMVDLENNIVKSATFQDFTLQDTDECLETICRTIERFLDENGIDRRKILGMGISITGRVNPNTGRSYKYFTDSVISIQQLFEERIGVRILLENDSRARCFAEYSTNPNLKDEKNLLYLHLGRGVAVGIVIDGKLYYGKSGFAGEFGHTPFFDNEIICACGKKGCLETEISGIAIENTMTELMKRGVNSIVKKKFDRQGSVHIDDIVEAAHNDDTLSIELLEQAGEKAGKSVAFLINIFNPETVIIGGNLSKAGDFLLLSLKSSVSKYSLGLVYNDTKFVLSEMDQYSASRGAAMLIRNKLIGF